MSDFDKWIEGIESFEIKGNGVYYCSYEYRDALKAAFEAGKKAERDQNASVVARVEAVIVKYDGYGYGDSVRSAAQAFYDIDGIMRQLRSV